MSIKSKIFAAAATLTMVGGLGAAGTLTANAATPSCGHNCIDIFSRQFGTHKHPTFVLDVFQQKAKAGQPIISVPDQQLRPGGGLHHLLPGHGRMTSSRLAW